jgi:hypothetical protein
MMNFKYGQHRGLKHLVPDYDFAMVVMKHINRQLTELLHADEHPRAVNPERQKNYQEQRRVYRQALRDNMYSVQLHTIVNTWNVRALPPLLPGTYDNQTFGELWQRIQQNLKAKKRALVYHCIVSHFMKTLLQEYHLLRKIFFANFQKEEPGASWEAIHAAAHREALVTLRQRFIESARLPLMKLGANLAYEHAEGYATDAIALLE